MSLTKITVLERGLYNKVLMYKLLEEYNKRILIILYKGEKKKSKTKVSQHFNQNQYVSSEETHTSTNSMGSPEWVTQQITPLVKLNTAFLAQFTRGRSMNKTGANRK